MKWIEFRIALCYIQTGKIITGIRKIGLAVEIIGIIFNSFEDVSACAAYSYKGVVNCRFSHRFFTPHRLLFVANRYSTGNVGVIE